MSFSGQPVFAQLVGLISKLSFSHLVKEQLQCQRITLKDDGDNIVMQKLSQVDKNVAGYYMAEG